MITTVGTVRTWTTLAKEESIAYLIVVRDTLSGSDYPVEVWSWENFYEKYDYYDGKNRQEIVEVYDLSMGLEYQLNEKRAFHPPPRSEIFRRS